MSRLANTGVIKEMKIEDTKKIEAFYLRWDKNRDKKGG
jgi:hypothetical protein